MTRLHGNGIPGRAQNQKFGHSFWHLMDFVSRISYFISLSIALLICTVKSHGICVYLFFFLQTGLSGTKTSKSHISILSFRWIVAYCRYSFILVKINIFVRFTWNHLAGDLCARGCWLSYNIYTSLFPIFSDTCDHLQTDISQLPLQVLPCV